MAHSLKTMMLYLGLIRLHKLLELIEKESKLKDSSGNIDQMIREIENVWEKASKELKEVIN